MSIILIAYLYFTLLLFIFSSYDFGYHFLSWTGSLLLYYPPLLLSLFTLYSSLPSCEVMYGPCQRWNQWDAGCFNLAWEPSGSRSSASWKSDGSGLSLLCFYSPPSVLPRSLHWSTLNSRWTTLRGGPHHPNALENKWAHLLSVNMLQIRISTNRWVATQSEVPTAKAWWCLCVGKCKLKDFGEGWRVKAASYAHML